MHKKDLPDLMLMLMLMLMLLLLLLPVSRIDNFMVLKGNKTTLNLDNKITIETLSIQFKLKVATEKKLRLEKSPGIF